MTNKYSGLSLNFKSKENSPLGDNLSSVKSYNTSKFYKYYSPKQYVYKSDIKEKLESSQLEYRNSIGLKYNSDGTSVDRNHASYCLYVVTKQNKEVFYGWYDRHRKFDWGTIDDFEKQVARDNRYSIGRLKFETYEEVYRFLRQFGGVYMPQDNNREYRNVMPMWVGVEYIEQSIKDVIGQQDLGEKTMVNIETQLMDEEGKNIHIFGKIRNVANGVEICNPTIKKTIINKQKHL